MLDTPPGSVAGGNTPLERKRALYWHNRWRNAFVARVARAFADGELGVLTELGVPAAACPGAGRSHPRVAVLVESKEHGQALLQFLPGWTMHDAVGVSNSPAVAQTGTTEPAMMLPAVITSVLASRTVVHADVLVRATGGYGRLHVREVTEMVDARAATARLVIDFEDEFDLGAAADARRREREYQTDDRYRVDTHTGRHRHAQAMKRNPSDASEPLRRREVGPVDDRPSGRGSHLALSRPAGRRK
jgi:hypothetical protein